jgi:UDP-N-acetylmuramoyl-L-alanyl-D-glutamate--2,6-diaminopimelate ligase
MGNQTNSNDFSEYVPSAISCTLAHLIENITYKEIQFPKDLESNSGKEIQDKYLQNIIVRSISIDSRNVSEGTIFIARKGQQSDGHDYIQQVISRGAVAIICERLPENHKDLAAVFIVVQDSSVALAECAHCFYDFPSKKLSIIGITGTNGKTTSTFIVKQIIESITNKPVGLIGTTGNYLGDEVRKATHTTPESHELCALLHEMHSKGIYHVVMEVSSHSLVLNRVYGVEFKATGFTNLTQDHLDFHGTMEAYAEAKKILFDMTNSNAVSVVNNDSEYGKYMVSTSISKPITFGRSLSADIRISNEKLLPSSSQFMLNDNAFESPLTGAFNVENVALAIGIVTNIIQDVPDTALQSAVRTAIGAPGRMTKIEIPNGSMAIVDYAHTPDALAKALDTCRDLLNSQINDSSGSLICIFGCGGNRDSTKRPIMGKISSEKSDMTIITNDNPRTENPELIATQIQDGMIPNHPTKVILNRRSAIEYAVTNSSKGDIILIAGKGHEKTQTIGTSVSEFDDINVVTQIADTIATQ